MENSMEIPLKVKDITTLRSSNCPTGHLPQKYKITNSKGYMHPYVYDSVTYNTQIIEAAQVSIDKLKKMWYIYTMEYDSAIKNLAFCDDMDGSREYNGK